MTNDQRIPTDRWIAGDVVALSDEYEPASDPEILKERAAGLRRSVGVRFGLRDGRCTGSTTVVVPRAR